MYYLYVSVVCDSVFWYVHALHDSCVLPIDTCESEICICSSWLVCITYMYLQFATRMYSLYVSTVCDSYVFWYVSAVHDSYVLPTISRFVCICKFAPQMWFMTQTSMTQFDSLVTHVCHTHTRAHTHIHIHIHTYTHAHIHIYTHTTHRLRGQSLTCFPKTCICHKIAQSWKAYLK